MDAEALPAGFEVIPLRPLTLEECRTLWTGLTKLDIDSARIRPLQILTGGSPRLIHILAQFMRTPSLSDLMENLNRLIDQNTEYFKNQLDLLPSGERKIFVTLLDAWNPSSAKDVAEKGRVAINLASAALNRLSERGMVEKNPGPGRSILYHASERLFNIYYLMRRRTHPSDRVRALVTFMTQYYDQKELVDTTTKLAFEACSMEPSERGDFHSVFEAIFKGLPDAARAEMLRRTPEDFLKSFRRDEFVQRFSTPPSSEPQGPPIKGSYQSFLRAAREALSAGNYADASRQVEKAAVLRPKAIQPWILRALIGLFSGDHEASIAAASSAVEMKPDKMAAHSILGTALAAAGRDAEAEIALLKAIELDPNAMRALIELGKLRSKQGETAEAIAFYRRASQASPLQDLDVAEFGRLLARQNLDDEAKAVLSEAVERIDDPRYARRALAELYFDQDQYDQAAALLEQSAQAADEWFRWADYASFLIDAQHDGVRAQAAIREALDRDISSPFLYWHLARACRLSGAEDEDIGDLADRCIQAHVDDANAWIIAGQILELIDDEDQAEAIYDKAIADGHDPSGQASFLLGRLLARQPWRASEAEAALRTAIEKGQGEKCGPLKDLAELLVHRGDDSQAERLVTDALGINKRCYCSLLLKGEIAIRNHDFRLARSLLKQAIDVDPQGVTAMTALARISESGEATQLIEQAYAIDPAHPLVLLARGRSCERTLDERLVDVEDALEREPDLTEALLELASLHARRGDAVEVADLLAEALSALATRMELIPSFVDSAIEIAHSGMADIVEEALSGPEGAVMEPLLVALRMERGENPVVPKEVKDVAVDILDRMQSYEGGCGTLFREGEATRPPYADPE